jgi:hypothetical protein
MTHRIQVVVFFLSGENVYNGGSLLRAELGSGPTGGVERPCVGSVPLSYLTIRLRP